MSLSDILTILGLIAAIIAFVSEKNREYLFLKFSYLHFGLLIAFEWFKGKNLYVSWLIIPGWPTVGAWAYIITVLILVFLFYRVYYGFFPSQNREKLISYYKNQILKGEFSFLVGLIERYHKNDISKYLELDSKNEVNPPILAFEEKAYEKELLKIITSNRLKIANNVYYEIIIDNTFIDNTVNTHPYLFADFICHLNTQRTSDEDFVYHYLSILIENNNYHLIRELRHNQNYNRHHRYNLPEENKILRSLFLDCNVANYNYAWQPFGQLTCKYLEQEAEKNYSPLKNKYREREKDELWSLRIYQAIWFFDIMVRESIGQSIPWHMWLFYFRHFTDLLIEVIPDQNDYDSDSEHPSYAHYMIYKQFNVMLEWLRVAHELNTDSRVIDTIRCLGWCVNSICQADDAKISAEFKRRQVERILTSYFNFSDSPDNIASTTAREWFERLFLNPKGVDYGVPIRTTEYLHTLQDAWDHFDKIPYQHHEDNGSIEQFVTNVITPLGLRE
jgi:hypothetical protein